jgi:hypothetical protein
MFHSMAKLLPVIICIGLLLAGVRQVHARAGVYPADAARLRPVELSRLIARLLPAAGPARSWDDQLRRDPVLHWTSDRSAHVRVLIDGRPSKLLPKKSGREFAWTVERLVDDDNGPYGRELLKITPGPEGDGGGDPCYDNGAPGCMLGERTLLRPGMYRATPLCSPRLKDSTGLRLVLGIRSPGKRPSVLLFVAGHGSHTGYTAIYLAPFADPAAVCLYQAPEPGESLVPRLPPLPPSK